ncbi:uncharacterized protein LOC118410619 [Branchiostoma floridae]|uniref:Uncharacterized protein LOC118410619 n=1 Tax=Branchiostoma floridae TaxID=7739 RepID=A0A9J7KRS1_BRAFL|nr:uncharacterized protein LOC118410619 [Branchiostoma floridae]
MSPAEVEALLGDWEPTETADSGTRGETVQERAAPDGDDSSRPRFANLTETELGQIEDERVEKTTAKSTKWGVKIFREWLKSRQQCIEFEGLPPKDLGHLLRQFYAEVRSTAGTEYSKASYGCLRAAIHRHLTGPPFHKTYNILRDPEFQAANNMFVGMLKKLRRSGLDTAKSFPPILPCDMIKMFDSGTLSMDNPLALQRLVYFYIAFFLCRRGRENLRELKVSDFILKDEGGRKYYTLRHNEHLKNHPGHLVDDSTQPTSRMYEMDTGSGTRPCPVKAFEQYCSKLPDTSKCPYLFQRTNVKYKPDSGSPWYYPQPLGHNKIGAMMKDISAAAGLSKPYTNHSIRVTAIQVLDESGFETRVIMSISGHKNEASVRRYTHDSTDKQKQQCANALQTALSSNKEDCYEQSSMEKSNSTNSANDVPHSLRAGCPDTHVHDTGPEVSVNLQSTCMSQMSQVFSTSGHINFHCPVTFNFK